METQWWGVSNQDIVDKLLRGGCKRKRICTVRLGDTQVYIENKLKK